MSSTSSSSLFVCARTSGRVALVRLKQGWAFAWRSLMAGELIVVVANRPSIGARLQFARALSDAPGLLALMIVVLIIGIVVDTVFGKADLVIRRRRGLEPGGNRWCGATT